MQKILIVEDEGLIAHDIAGQLEKIGYGIEGIASSGEEALQLLEQGLPDLILMDIRLQGELDGIEVAMRVRAHYRLPVIFLTSHSDSATLGRAKLAEPFGYLVKPFRHMNLASAIEIALFKHKSERALIEREAWLSTVLHCSPDATIVTNEEGRVQFLNAIAEQLLGRRLAEVAGLRWTEAAGLLDRETGVGAEELLRGASPGEAVTMLPLGLVLRREDGKELSIEGAIAPSVSQGRVAGAVVTLRDVSERNQAEAEARRQHKMVAIGRMAGGVAHDFNSLLTVILGNGELLAASLSAANDLARLAALLEAARTAGELTRQLLAVSGKLVLKADLVNVNRSAERLVQLMTPGLGANQRVLMDLDDAAGLVRINTAQFDQILLNLLVNAMDAMPEGGTLRVSTARVERVVGEAEGGGKKGFTLLTVMDTGPGIAPEAQEHLFDPFFTTKAFGRGTGLGLAIVRGIVEDARGTVSVCNAGASGACFEVLLPIEEQAPPEEEACSPRLAESIATLEKSGRVRTILLAEDHPALQLLVRTFLEQQGFAMLAAGNGEEALKLAAAHPGSIDLLIADVLMPLMDGPTLARELALVRPSTKTLLISGDPGHQFAALREAGLASTFLQKPFGLPRLLEKVEELTTHRLAP